MRRCTSPRSAERMSNYIAEKSCRLISADTLSVGAIARNERLAFGIKSCLARCVTARHEVDIVLLPTSRIPAFTATFSAAGDRRSRRIRN